MHCINSNINLLVKMYMHLIRVCFIYPCSLQVIVNSFNNLAQILIKINIRGAFNKFPDFLYRHLKLS